MRVLHFCPNANMAGASRSMLTLVRELGKTQPTYVVVFFEDDLAAAARECGANVRVIYPGKRPYFRFQRMSRSVGCLAKAIRDWQIDILHVHTAVGNRYAWPATLLTGAKLLTHQRDNFEHNYYHKMLGRADKIIAISDWVKRGLPEKLQSRTEVIYNSTVLPKLEDTVRSPDDGQIVVGMAGRCYPEKGFDILLDAFVQINPPPHVRLLMWGLPPREKCNEYGQQVWDQYERIEPSLRERIHLEPFRVDIEKFYRSVDIVVVPSRFAEPFGRMAIEAMSWRRPVIVAGHGGLPEIVTDHETGLVFRPLDAADLGRKLQLLLADEALRNRLAEAGRQEIGRRFTPEAHLKAVSAVYESLV
jgi:glycosyltransferase involved in cell wall biosynthesis